MDIYLWYQSMEWCLHCQKKEKRMLLKGDTILCLRKIKTIENGVENNILAGGRCFIEIKMMKA